MTTVFITGGAGFIGSHAVKSFLARGYRVVNLDKLTYAGNVGRLDDVADHADYHFIHGDIGDTLLVQSIFDTHRPSAVINFAAETHVDRSIDGPAAFIETNVNGTLNLLAQALRFYKTCDAQDKNNFRFLHVSTDEVYGDLAVDEPAFTRDHPYKPSSPYSASKAAADHLVRAWHKTYGLPTLITNCSNNYGTEQYPEKLIPHVILCALSDKILPIYGTGQNIRDWIHVSDHVNAIARVLEAGTPGQTYLVGGNNEQTNLDVVSSICGILDRILPRKDGKSYCDQISFVSDRPGHDRRYAIDNSAVTAELGWKPEISWDKGLKETVFWYASNIKRVQSLSSDYDLSRLGLVA